MTVNILSEVGSVFGVQDNEEEDDIQPFARLFARVSSAQSGGVAGGGGGGGTKQQHNANVHPGGKEKTERPVAKPRPAPKRQAKIDKLEEDDDSEEDVTREPEAPKAKRQKGPGPKQSTRTTSRPNGKEPKDAEPDVDAEDAAEEGETAGVGLSDEDREVIQRFETLVLEHKEMVPSTRDDTGFNQWAKDCLGLSRFEIGLFSRHDS